MSAVFCQHPEIFACLHFFCSISFKRWLENQTILTVYLHFPKLLPCSGRIVNSLCPLRCEGEHGTITGLRCWGARGLPGQLFMWGLPAPNEPSRDERCFLHEGRMVPRVCPPGTVRRLCARQQGVSNLSRQSSTGWIKQNHLLSWDQQLSNQLPLSLEIRGKITSWVSSVDILFFKKECNVPVKLKTAPQNDLKYPVHV